jgi:hypothetical protein
MAELELKIQGRNPDAFSTELAPVYDTRALYRLEQRAVAFLSSSHSSSGTGPIIPVPSGEQWIVQAISACMQTVPAANQFGLGLRFFERSPGGSSASGIVLAETALPQPFSDITVQSVTWQPQVTDFIAQPGDRFQGYLVRTLTASTSLNLHVLYTRILL